MKLKWLRKNPVNRGWGAKRALFARVPFHFSAHELFQFLRPRSRLFSKFLRRTFVSDKNDEIPLFPHFFQQ